ncbi:host RNA manipulator TomO [Wolbachia endosymbiont of Rhagoletis indifferens]|uniref:host RNA manipulator TomO n=1 Tax=Wolbachia endosymbiont of Rhagoletis indifferens TaxID=3383250 RepID=UPI003AF3DFF7
MLANFPDGCDRSFTVELKDEDSYGIIPKNLTFAEIINILNQAVREDDCEELDEVVQNIEDYEGRSIMLDNENLKDFCSNQLNLELQNRSNHQHIYSNVLSQYKFDQEGFKYDYSVKELVLLAIAANVKLTERYQDILFAEGNLSLLPLLVGGQKYIEAFIEKFHGTDGVYGRLKDQAIQLVEPNKIDFFSVIALRKEQELLNAVFVEYVLRDLEQVLKTSKPDPLYGVLETASLIKNEEFITVVLSAFERYVNEPTKKASTEELLKKSFATLLETAISQERISIIEYLCKRYTNSADHAIYDVYKQAFADDKVITILRQQILKNIGARGRKEIYDLILKTALDAGNIAFIDHLCKECAECSNDVINYLDHKSKNNEFDEIYESILVALSNTGSQDIIISVLAHVQIYQSILNNKQQVVRQTIQNILSNAIKEASYGVVVPLCQHVDLKFAALQAICKEEFEKALPVVAEQLEKISMELSPSMTRNEYQKNRDTLNNLYLIRSLLESSKLINTSSKANIQTQANTQVNKRSSDNAVSPIVNVEDTSAMIGETATSSQAVDGKNNSQLSSQKSKSTDSQQPQENVDRRENIMNNREGSTEELISNSFEEGEMGKNSAKKRKESIKQFKEEKKKNEQEKEEQFRETYIGNNNSSQVTTEEDDKNDATAPLVDIGKKEQTPVQPAEHVPQYGLGNTSVQPDNSDTSVIVEKGPVLGAANGEDSSAHEGNDRQDTQSKSSSAEVPLVGNKKLEQNGIPTNSKQSTNPNNGSQNIKSSKLPVIAASALAVAGVVSGVAIAVYLEMLAAGIAVGACCLVAAAVIYCCTPKNSVENSNVETVKTAELTAQ